MSLLDSATRSNFPAVPGTNHIRVSNLASGTLYAIYFKGLAPSRVGSVVVPATSGPGAGLITYANLPVAAKTLVDLFKTETGSQNFPAAFFVGGASANYTKTVPQMSIDSDASNDLNRVIRVAVPDFNNPPAAGLDYLEVRISRDKGVTFPEVKKLPYPFADNLNYAVTSIGVPYESDVQVIAQGFFKDGQPGRISRTLVLTGYPKPSTNNLAPPVIVSAVGALTYTATTNAVKLSLTVVGIPDAAADALQITIINPADGTPKDSRIVNADPAAPAAKLTVNFDNLDASIATYNIVAASVKYAVPSALTTLAFTTPLASTYHPAKINPATITLAEVIENVGGLKSRIQVKWTADQSQPKANIYLRRRDTFGGDLSSMSGFSSAGTSATPSFLTDPVVAGVSVQWDVVVLAVGVTGTEAVFSSDQIKTVAVQQYANYSPILQTVPTVTIVSDDQVTLKGAYARPANTPAPIFVNIYKSETLTDAANLIAKVPLQADSTGSTYNWQYDVQSLKAQFASSGISLITVRYALENGFESAATYKSVVKVVATVPGTVPTISAATAYVKTVGATITNCTASLTNAVAGYTAATGGNGTMITLTPPLNALIIEVSDDGAGLNAEILTPQTDMTAPTMWASFAPTKNQGTKYIRAKFNTLFGLTGFSTSRSVVFPADNVIDAVTPDPTPCVPRYVCNADGSITISWVSATFGTSGMGSYSIRRNTANNGSTSVIVGEVSSSYTNGGTFTWTDFLTAEKQGYTYYYWLEATSGAGLKGSMIPVKLQSGNSYAVETVTGAISTDAVPATVASITAVGAQGGFNITWAGVADRDLKEYQLEFSALGTFVDTVTVAVKSNSYYQTLGATASAAVAGVYRWRVKAKDFGNQLSAAYATSVAPDLTNYGSIQDSAPAAATAPTIVAGTDGSITVTLTASAAPYFHIKRLSSSATWTPATSGSGDNAKIEQEDILDGASTKYVDTGLNPLKFYTYQVFTRSKLGTDATTFPAPPTPVQPTIIIQGVNRSTLIYNGHFGTAQGGYGTSYTGWTLGSGVSFVSASGNVTIGTANYPTSQYLKTGATAQVLISQNFQVLPGKKYTVMGVIYYYATTQDGRGYIRVSGAGALSDASAGALTAPVPYSSFGAEASGIDYTTSSRAYRFISYSFTAPTNVNQMTLQIGYESRTASDQAYICPAFIQIFQDQ